MTKLNRYSVISGLLLASVGIGIEPTLADPPMPRSAVRSRSKTAIPGQAPDAQRASVRPRSTASNQARPSSPSPSLVQPIGQIERQAAARAGNISQVAATSTVESESATLKVHALETVAVSPIDLATALSLVDVQNPEFLKSQQMVVTAVAERQLAAVQILPTLNVGTSYDGHTGTLLQSSGNVLKVKRNSLFVGAGASAIGGGTVNIPGVLWTLNVSDAAYRYLGSKQLVIQREHESVALRNELGLQVSLAYLDLLEAEAARSIAWKVRDEAAEVAKITDAYAQTGQGRLADAQRAASELRNRESEILEQEAAAFRASARLSKLLSFETTLRLHATDNWLVPHPIVPDPIPLPELLAIALLQRPELQAQHAAVQRALVNLDAAKMLPFSPTLFAGFSAGTYGGGSNLVTAPTGSTTFGRSEPRFGAFTDRTDFDVMAYWTLRNLGVGNKALTAAASSRLRSSDLQQLVVCDKIRSEVATAHTRVHARFAQIATGEQAVLAATDSWTEDLIRIKNREGLPIEVLHSLKLLAKARREYMEAIVEYNRAQFELYVALGQPAAEVLVRSAGTASAGENGIETPAAD